MNLQSRRVLTIQSSTWFASCQVAPPPWSTHMLSLLLWSSSNGAANRCYPGDKQPGTQNVRGGFQTVQASCAGTTSCHCCYSPISYSSRGFLWEEPSENISLNNLRTFRKDSNSKFQQHISSVLVRLNNFIYITPAHISTETFICVHTCLNFREWMVKQTDSLN